MIPITTEGRPQSQFNHDWVVQTFLMFDMVPMKATEKGTLNVDIFHLIKNVPGKAQRMIKPRVNPTKLPAVPRNMLDVIVIAISMTYFHLVRIQAQVAPDDILRRNINISRA